MSRQENAVLLRRGPESAGSGHAPEKPVLLYLLLVPLSTAGPKKHRPAVPEESGGRIKTPGAAGAPGGEISSGNYQGKKPKGKWKMFPFSPGCMGGSCCGCSCSGILLFATDWLFFSSNVMCSRYSF